MKELTTFLKEEFIKQLHVLDWMDEATRRRAVDKAEMIEYKNGFPEVLFNDTWMDEHWGILIKPNEYLLHLTIRIKLARYAEELMRLDKPLDRSMWFQSPAQVDAYYAPNNNEMIFPAGIMQFPFLTLGVPNYITYGMVGAVIGHEVSHAFDDQGGRYDELGNLNDWWDMETAEKFAEKTRGGARLISIQSSVISKGEAYKAWRSNTSAEEPALPGFQNFTSEQMFFLAYANNWCSMVRPKHYVQIILTDVHAPSKYRATIPLRNRIEFADAFGCSLGTPMNPENKCQVW
ncbi:Neprilysin-21 [Parelaphostrongylus tenuis]|uniref:Neprilysin-21 n=1 Tax=Parelaphostrongylus tenuis TaxID=148309 RepID=A0AAD5QYX0_PARTN|nr:Neprilysin-21 [Parelaphostrongylus tenuis]